MNLVQSLKALSGYPIPHALVLNALESEGLSPDDEVTADIRKSNEYKRCKAAVYMFLSAAPNVSQGGISYSFTDNDKADFKRLANALLDAAGDDSEESASRVTYGYISDNF